MGPRINPSRSATSWRRFLGAFLTAVYFVQSVLLAAAPESNFWSERRRSQDAQRRTLAMASLPGPSVDAARVTAAWPTPAPEPAPGVVTHQAKPGQTDTTKSDGPLCLRMQAKHSYGGLTC
jgi:hypothetical protein